MLVEKERVKSAKNIRLLKIEFKADKEILSAGGQKNKRLIKEIDSKDWKQGNKMFPKQKLVKEMDTWRRLCKTWSLIPLGPQIIAVGGRREGQIPAIQVEQVLSKKW